tara:strand:- start:291 stop:1196 length:906 start_codon:yes stop_codon:yes gene_type:complete
MSGNPNAGSIMQGIGRQQDALALRRKEATAATAATSQSNATFSALKQAGVSDEVLAIARTNPELAKVITSSYLKQKMGVGDMVKFSGIQTDATTGAQYTVMSDPNTRTSTRVDVAGALQQTPQQRIDMESQARSKEADAAKAAEIGHQAFGQMEAMQSTIRDLQTAKDAVVNGGASTGIMQKWIPSFDAATSEFRVVANRLGIAVINSATFGALSEQELKLAMETGFPRDLQGPELIKWIDAKIDAQTKMKNALYSKARSLTSGIGYSEFIQAHGYKDGNNPNGSVVDPIQAAINKKKAGL